VSENEPTELVINGDFLDFVQAEPWQSKEFESQTSDGVPLCFAEEHSVEKLRGIFKAHSAAFEALRKLLNSHALHRVTILPGNHDADFFWPAVRRELQRYVANGKTEISRKLRFHLEQKYKPSAFRDLWIEHGHQRDTCNSFEVAGIPYWSNGRPPILIDEKGKRRLLECVGTRFMLQFMNRLDAKYPFVDNVKPFSKFVKLFLVSAFAPGFGPLTALVSYWALATFMAGRLAKAPKDLLSTEEDPSRLAQEAKRLVRELDENQAQQLTTHLCGQGFSLSGMPLKSYVDNNEANPGQLLDFLRDNPEILDGLERDNSGLLSSGRKGYLTLSGGFMADETQLLKEAALEIIRDRLATGVIMGHTHEPI
jgi:hypothetical protein